MVIQGVGGAQFHNGMDLKNEYGSPVYAMFDGAAVLKEQGDGKSGAGYYIIITSTIDTNIVKSYYFHMQKLNRVSGTVSQGDIIGYQGDSGNLKNAIDQGLSISHLHIKVRENGKVVNPSSYLKTKFDTTSGDVISNSGCN